jgi:hypothetical protein
MKIPSLHLQQPPDYRNNVGYKVGILGSNSHSFGSIFKKWPGLYGLWLYGWLRLQEGFHIYLFKLISLKTIKHLHYLSSKKKSFRHMQ